MYRNSPERQSLDLYIDVFYYGYFYCNHQLLLGYSSRKRSIRYTYITHPTENVSSIHLYRSHLGSPIFETLFFVITIQKPPSKPFISTLILSIYYKSIFYPSVSKTLTAWNEKLVKSAISPHIFPSFRAPNAWAPSAITAILPNAF